MEWILVVMSSCGVGHLSHRVGIFRVFPRRLTDGGFLTIGYCYPYCVLEFL